MADPATVSTERHYSIKEVARIWGLDRSTVTEIFDGELGVLRIERPETRSKRKYTTYRIPQSVLDRVHARLHTPKKS
jgi:hypothetical protein